jgi:hypothetical protein
MPTESISPTQVLKLARFGIASTLAFGILLLIATILANDRYQAFTGDLLKSLLYVLGAEVVVAIAAVTCVAIWRKPE